MSKYNNSKVYKIFTTLGNEIYIGSTTRKIEQRFKEHVSYYKAYTNDNTKQYMSSFQLFTQYGIQHCHIEKLENVNVETRKELLQVEAKYIKENKDICVNILLPYCSDDEKAQHKTIYRQRPEYVEHRKQYRDQSEQKQQRRDYNAQRYNCPCGYKFCKNTPRAIKHHLERCAVCYNANDFMNNKQPPTIIINNITNNITIQTVQTFNNNPIGKTQEQLELDELEKELERQFEAAMK